MVEIKNEYVEIIDKLLKRMDGGRPVLDGEMVKFLGIEPHIYAEIKTICLHYGVAQIPDGYGFGIKNTNMTKPYLESRFFRAEYERQKENAQRKTKIDAERAGAIKNRRWMLCFQIAGVIVAGAALVRCLR